MTGQDRKDVFAAIESDGIVPVFYDPDPSVAVGVALAVSAGGLTTLEFTNRGVGAIEIFAELSRETRSHVPDLILGAGSIVDPGSASQVIDLGARFVFAPAFSAEVAAVCGLRNIPYVPGCATVTEILSANRAGCRFVKLFPANTLGGPDFLSAVRAPCPWVMAIPTGEVEPTVESLSAWYRAGAPAVGMGSKLIASDLIAGRDFEGLEERVAAAVRSVAEARTQS